MKNFWLTPLTTVIVVVVFSPRATCECPKEKDTVVTYNAGLTPAVPGYDDRRLSVISAIRRKTRAADFVCLQEVWFERDMKMIINEMKRRFPYHFSSIHAGIGELRECRGRPKKDRRRERLPAGSDTVPCPTAGVTNVTSCFAQKCSTAVNARLCILINCATEVYSLPQECLSCFSTVFGAPGQLSLCGNPLEKYNRFNNPGLLVFSRKPLSSAEYVNFLEGEKVLIERGYITTQVGKNPKYVCTHLTPTFPLYFEVSLLDRFSSYAEQQAASIETLRKEFSGSTHVLLGDLNTGPGRNESGPVLDAIEPANYDKLINELGYQNPYIENNGKCTYCFSENPILVGAGTDQGDLAIDHVLTSNLDSEKPKRILDSQGTVLSDHFGVQLDICLP